MTNPPTTPNGDTPAYPFIVHDLSKTQWADQGLTKREYFAAHAPTVVLPDGTGSIANAAKILGIDSKDYIADIHFAQLVARDAVFYADALIAALNRRNP